MNDGELQQLINAPSPVVIKAGSITRGKALKALVVTLVLSVLLGLAIGMHFHDTARAVAIIAGGTLLVMGFRTLYETGHVFTLEREYFTIKTPCKCVRRFEWNDVSKFTPRMYRGDSVLAFYAESKDRSFTFPNPDHRGIEGVQLAQLMNRRRERAVTGK